MVSISSFPSFYLNGTLDAIIQMFDCLTQAISFLAHGITCNWNPTQSKTVCSVLILDAPERSPVLLLCLSMGPVPLGYMSSWDTALRSHTSTLLLFITIPLVFIWSIMSASNISQYCVHWIFSKQVWETLTLVKWPYTWRS